MKCKSFFAVVAAALHQFVVFSLFLISNLSIFLISYLRNKYCNNKGTRILSFSNCKSDYEQLLFIGRFC